MVIRHAAYLLLAVSVMSAYRNGTGVEVEKATGGKLFKGLFNESRIEPEIFGLNDPCDLEIERRAQYLFP